MTWLSIPRFSPLSQPRQLTNIPSCWQDRQPVSRANVSQQPYLIYIPAFSLDRHSPNRHKYMYLSYRPSLCKPTICLEIHGIPLGCHRYPTPKLRRTPPGPIVSSGILLMYPKFFCRPSSLEPVYRESRPFARCHHRHKGSRFSYLLLLAWLCLPNPPQNKKKRSWPQPSIQETFCLNSFLGLLREYDMHTSYGRAANHITFTANATILHM